MIVTDIVNHSREFRRAHHVAYWVGLVGVGAALNVYHVYGLFVDELLKRLAITYPPFMLVVTYMFMMSWLRAIGVIGICAVIMLLISYIATYKSPEPWLPVYFRQLRASMKSWPHIYLFFLICNSLNAGLSTIEAAFSGSSAVSFLVGSADGLSFISLVNLIGWRWFECLSIFVALFCFCRSPDAQRFHVTVFALRCLSTMKSGLVSSGCWYYALLFGCVSYLDRMMHFSLSWYLAPFCVAYIVSMFLLANGLLFQSNQEA